MDQLIGAVLALVSTFTSPNVLGQDLKLQKSEVLEFSQPIKTQTRFQEKFSTQSASIDRKTVYKDDPETEAGQEKILEEGEDGKKITTYKLTFYDGEEYSKEIHTTETVKPKDKIILRGTKIVWKTLDTLDGTISYWKKLRVYATHYDSRCPGCNETTAIGMRAGKGVIAVDPSVIKLKSRVYIPGYGHAIAGDTGGSIRGNMIDLGFDDARTSGWKAKFIDIYLL